MTAREEPPTKPGGVTSDENKDDDDSDRGSSRPSSVTLRLWSEVAMGLERSETVVWKNAVDSLRDALDYLPASEDARCFVERYMKQMINILLEQQPSKIGQLEKGCVEESLRLAVMIVASDVKSKADIAGGNCEILEVLSMIFRKKKMYYRSSKSSWNTHANGLPEVRMQMINKFRNIKGFSSLSGYLSARVGTSNFPPLEQLHEILHATAEAIPVNYPEEQASKVHVWEEDAIRIARSVMNVAEGETMRGLDAFSKTLKALHTIFARLAPTRRKEHYEFFAFWRGSVLKLISSQSLRLKVVGWEQMNSLIHESRAMRPPPRAYIVSGAGCQFVNGKYEYTGPTTQDGYSKPGSEIRYQLMIPDSVPTEDGGGKKLTLFRCTMRSQQKWWFLSEADEEQPGTDRDADYYQHKSKKEEEAVPPLSGWMACRTAGIEGPPTLEAVGVMVPLGEEYNSLEHQLAKWAHDEHLIELILKDSVHPEIIPLSKRLAEFMADTLAPAPAETVEENDPLRSALAKMKSECSSPSIHATALQALGKILSNVESHPTEEKYRRIKRANAAFQQRLGGVPGGQDALLASGFSMEGKESEGGEEGEGAVYKLVPSADVWLKLVRARMRVEEVVAETKEQQGGGAVQQVGQTHLGSRNRNGGSGSGRTSSDHVQDIRELKLIQEAIMRSLQDS